VARSLDLAPAVLVDGVSKSFEIPHEQITTLKERAMHPFKRTGADRLHALHDVSFSVPRGEFFGIVGRNGSGKSTLLKCMAGIYGTDAGRIHVDGRLSPFIELGVGFNMDLAARENVYLNAVMLGLSPERAKEIFEPVMEFSELHQFADLKLKNYSSGMLVRLAFSVMIQVHADILLIDEVLAVGDANFQQKCFDVFGQMRDEGRTILLVTHDTSAVIRFCHRALLLEQGQVVTVGEPATVANRYLEMNFAPEHDTPAELQPDETAAPKRGDGSAEIEEAWIEDRHGQRRRSFAHQEDLVLRARVRFHRALDNPSFNVIFVTEGQQNLWAASSIIDEPRTGRFEAGETAELVLSFENAFSPGRYHVSLVMAHEGLGTDIIDRRDALFSFLVASPRAAGGLVDLPHELSIERLGARVGEPAT